MKLFLTTLLCLLIPLGTVQAQGTGRRIQISSIRSLTGRNNGTRTNTNRSNTSNRTQTNTNRTQTNNRTQMTNTATTNQVKISNIYCLGAGFTNGRKTFKFRVYGESNGLANQNVEVSLYFYNSKQQAVQAAGTEYRSSDGQLSIRGNVTPTGERYSFNVEYEIPQMEIIRALNGSNVENFRVKCIAWCNGKAVGSLTAQNRLNFYYNSASCTRCRGQYRVQCGGCGGSGRCVSGIGSQTVWNGFMYIQQPVTQYSTCNACSGSGTLTCPDCEGTGTMRTASMAFENPPQTNTGGGGGGGGYTGGYGGGGSRTTTTTTTTTQPQTCYSCGGSGNCRSCGGLGHSIGTDNGNCKTCYGSGRCPGCRGTGHY